MDDVHSMARFFVVRSIHGSPILIRRLSTTTHTQFLRVYPARHVSSAASKSAAAHESFCSGSHSLRAITFMATKLVSHFAGMLAQPPRCERSDSHITFGHSLEFSKTVHPLFLKTFQPLP
jgi:hypothetical protein